MTGTPRVLMLLGNNAYPDDPRVLREATSLVAAGYRVTVVCPGDRDRPRRDTVDGVAVLRFRGPPEPASAAGHLLETAWVTLACLRLAVGVLLTQGIDVVHVHNPPDTLAVVAALLKALGSRVVFDHHDLAPELYAANSGGEGQAVIRRGLEAFERLSCRVADRVVTANASHRAVEMERCGIDPSRIAIVRNGPDPDLLRPAAPEPRLVAADRFTVGWMGHMSHHDGIDHLLLAMRHLVGDLGRPDARLLLLGTGGAMESCRALAAELGLGDHVAFLGFVPYAQLATHLCATDVCTVPDPSNSYNDRCTMIKVLEYMALERPIVAYDLPETRVSAGDAALYVERNDTRAFARGLETLARDAGRRRAMGREGRRRVEEGLAWSYSVPPLLQTYADLLGAPAGAAVGALAEPVATGRT